MFPKGDESCVPPNLLRPELTVMDVVYNPRDTKLMLDAKAAGCRTIQGLEMFLNQAAQQFELWVNRPAPIDVMRTVLESRFQ
jgi:shikimate dehydrogenase